MLTQKLMVLKNELDSQSHKSDDDRKTLEILKRLNKDFNLEDAVSQDDFIIKSFRATQGSCPACGKKF